jgi:exonuclease SbcC
MIEEGGRRLKEARQRFESLEQARTQFDALTQEKGVLSQTIETRRVRLESQLEQLRHRAEIELPPKAQAEAALVQEQAQMQCRLEELGLQEQENARQRQHYQVLATSIGETQSTASRLEVEGKEIGDKLKVLQNTDHQEAACPLCGTPLGIDGCTRLADTYRAEIEDKRRQYRKVQSKLKQMETEKSGMEKELSAREQAISRAQRGADVRLREVERQIEESRQAQQELEQLKPQMANILTSLESGEFAVAEHEQVKALERQIAALDYSEQARQGSLAEMRALQGFEERQFQLTQAMARLPEEEESLSQSRDMLQRRQQELSQQEEKYQTSTEVLSQLPQWETQLRDTQQALDDLESSRQSAISRRGYLEGQVRRTEQLRQQINEDTSRLAELEEEQGIYQELVAAFGKQGVQAMLIETVVPRLEEEANLLLGRMTDNRMHVKLETQRERRTGRAGGDPIETLEINVSDELGPRSYEMYSGGEAFRVNLALRIALSKVLAQRMGAPLPTLFIDEGFGTQDAAGRERILDVIGAIQDDFDKIIVITHLDELKDMFPVRIEVQKDGNGSTFWLN